MTGDFGAAGRTGKVVRNLFSAFSPFESRRFPFASDAALLTGGIGGGATAVSESAVLAIVLDPGGVRHSPLSAEPAWGAMKENRPEDGTTSTGIFGDWFLLGR